MKHPKPRVETAIRPILVCDVHDFSRITSELGDRGPEFLNDFYCELGEIVVSEGGSLVKYLGDGFVALFGDNGYVNAVSAAIRMRRAFESLLGDYEITVESELETGIAAGKIGIAEVGHPSLRSKEVMGRAVMEASMIGDYRGIAVTEAVRNGITDRYETRPIESMKVKWRPDPMPLWEIVEDASHE